MTTEQMNTKLGRIRGRVSGLEEGYAVRGTNSRGARDIAVLGKVTFESIAADGRLHTCRIFPSPDYEAEDARAVTPKVRKRLGIDDAANVLYRVVNERYLRGRPILVTTTKPLAALGHVLHDPDLAEAILDRLLEHGHHFALRGRS